MPPALASGATWQNTLTLGRSLTIRVRCARARAGECRLTVEFANLLFHLFARLERDDALGADIDALASARIAGLTGFTPFHLEHAEIAQLDATFFEQGLHDGVKGFL